MSAKIKSRPDNEGNPLIGLYRALRARSPERAGGSAKFSPRRLPWFQAGTPQDHVEVSESAHAT